jgi:hypothetical protein
MSRGASVVGRAIGAAVEWVLGTLEEHTRPSTADELGALQTRFTSNIVQPSAAEAAQQRSDLERMSIRSLFELLLMLQTNPDKAAKAAPVREVILALISVRQAAYLATVGWALALVGILVALVGLTRCGR